MPDPVRDNPERFLYSTKTKYEFQFGYSRAVRHGTVIRVAGTAGLDDAGSPLTSGIVEQTRRALGMAKDDARRREDGRKPRVAGASGSSARARRRRDADWVPLVGRVPRGPGRERGDLSKKNGPIFGDEGKAIGEYGSKNVPAVVIG